MARVRSVGVFKDLHEAARKGAIAQVNEFLDLGVDANVRRDDGSTPLMWAAFNAHPGKGPNSGGRKGVPLGVALEPPPSPHGSVTSFPKC